MMLEGVGVGSASRACLSLVEGVNHSHPFMPLQGVITLEYNAWGLIILLLTHPEGVILCLRYSASAGRKMIHH